MANALSFDEEQAILAGIQREAERIRGIELTAQKATADRFAQIYRNYPMLPPGIALNMAKTRISDDTVKKIATEIAIAANENPDAMNGKEDGNWLHSAVKGAARLGFATFDTSLELVQNVGGRLLGPAINFVQGAVESGSQQIQAAQVGATPQRVGATQILDAMPDAPTGDASFLGSTTLKTLIDNWDKQGSGWFVSDEIRQEQAARARAFRGTTHGGHAWTIGRAGATMVFKEDSLGYNLMSGILDGLVAVKTPVVPGAGKGLRLVSELAEAPTAGRGVQAAGVVTDTLLGRGTAIKVSELTGEELRDARRIAGLIGDTVDPAEANKFFGTRGGRRLVERLVEANSYDDVQALVGRNVYADTVKRLRDAKTEFEVQEVLADVLGVAGKGITRTEGVKGVRAVALTNARRTKFLQSLDAIPFGAKVKKGMANVARPIGDISAENPFDVRNTINAMDDWMRVSMVDEVTRRKILDQAADALVGDTATPTARVALKEAFETVITDSLKANGVNENVVDGVFKPFFDVMKKRQEWNRGVSGEIDDAGFYNAVNINGTTVTDHAFGGPMLASELARVTIDMPDVRQVRALTNRWNGIWRKKGILGRYADDNLQRLEDAGKLRLLPAAAVYFQDQIFKRLVLMTGGYSIRNLNEAQMRIALSNRDIDGVYNHPLAWLGWSFGKKGRADILGQEFTEDTLQESMRFYREGIQASKYNDYGDPSDALRRGQRLGTFDPVDRRNPEHFDFVVSGHADQIGKLNSDYVARLHASGYSEDEIVDLIKNTEEGKKWFRYEQDYHMNGRKVYDKKTGIYTGVTQQVDLTDDANLRYLIREIQTRVEAQVGGDSRLRNIIASGQMPAERVVAKEVGIVSTDVGNVVTIAPKGRAKTPRQVRVISYDANTGEAVVAPFAFARGEATPDFNRLLRQDDVFYNPNLAPIVPRELRFEKMLSRNKGMKEAWDNTTDRAFAWLYGKPSKYLDRSPLFRQFYYEMAIDNLLTSLSPADARRLLDNIERSARQYNVPVKRFLGGDKRYQRIQDAANGRLGMKGTLTLEEVDEIAKMNAVEDLRRLLYDASERSNFVDAARVVFPFAKAYAEFFKAVGKAYTVPTRSGIPLPNVSSLRKTQLVVEGGREADPDQNGRGFFFVDRETGEWSFTYPGSQWVSKTIAKVPAAFTAPVSGAIQGIDLGQRAVFGLKLNPGLGPWATIAASKVLDYVPNEDAVKRFFLPYGEPAFEGSGPSALAEAFLPAWMKKAWVTWVSGQNESLDMEGSAFFEARQALAAGGQYDILNADPLVRAQEEERLDKDASRAGHWLSIMRTFGQALGPSRPTPEFRVKAKDGDVFVNQAMADYRKWQEEDYDTATVKFFDTYGEHFWPYLARKTTSEPFEGLAATAEVGKWEEANNDFLYRHPEVAAYFAPVEGKFDWQVYTRQVIEKKRRKLNSGQAFDEAQWFAANAQYRLAEKMGLTEDQLKAFKKELQQQYPGYKNRDFDVKKVARQIEELQAVANLPRLDGNQTAEGLRLYFAERDKAMFEVERGGKGIGTKANAPIRDWLRSKAQEIIAQYPDFGRLYERVLAREIEE